MDNSTQKPKDNFIIAFMRILKELIEEPPYLMFYFVNSIFLIVSLLWKEDYFWLFLILLVYSMIGVVWRHATKDFGGKLEKPYRVKLKEKCEDELKKQCQNKLNKINLWRVVIYQLVNIILIVILVVVLVLFGLRKF